MADRQLLCNVKVSVDTHVAMVHVLAAKVAKGKNVSPSDIEAAVKREFGIDVTGKLADLLGPITESYAIYDAARKRICKSPGYKELLALPEKRSPELCQESDDFETVYAQAAPAQAPRPQFMSST